jgi:hypothetical protein
LSELSCYQCNLQEVTAAQTSTVSNEIYCTSEAAAEINDKVPILREVVAQATAHADTAQAVREETAETFTVLTAIDGCTPEAASESNEEVPASYEVAAQYADTETAGTSTVRNEIDGETSEAAEINDEEPVLHEVVAQAVDGATVRTTDGETAQFADAVTGQVDAKTLKVLHSTGRW